MIKIKGVYLFHEADMRVAFRAAYDQALIDYSSWFTSDDRRVTLALQDYMAMVYKLAEQAKSND